MDWKYENGRIYSLDENNVLLAEATYIFEENGEVNIDHTFVSPALRGQGIAGKMMEVTALHLREKQLKATAGCSYANSWLKKHRKEYSDIISDRLDSEAAACKIDGRH